MSIYNFVLTHTGISHREKNLFNQDSVGCYCIHNSLGKKIYLNIVADGVSACKYAGEASTFLQEVSVHVFVTRCENNENYTLNLVEFKDCVEEIFEKYKVMIEKNKSQFLDYGSTLELVAIQDESAYVLHAGDGLILAVQEDGNVLLTDTEKHTGEYGSQVIPFFVKSKWEFIEIGNIAAILVASDGVYDEIVPTSARRLSSKFDLSLLIPCIDSRVHKNDISHKRFLDSYITGNLSDEIMYYKCSQLICKKVITGKDDETIKRHFIQNVPYKKNVRSRDDLSVTLWGNTEFLPDNYDITEHLPNYRKQWEMERKLNKDRALSQQQEIL